MKLSGMTVSFLKLLVDKKRIDILEDIVVCYRQLMDEALKKVRVNLKTAFPLSDELQIFISSNLEKITGQKVEMTVEEDSHSFGRYSYWCWRYTLRWQYQKSVEQYEESLRGGKIGHGNN